MARFFSRDRNRRNVPLPEGIDWSMRASPLQAAADEGFSIGTPRHLRRMDEIARENATYLRLKHQRLGGVIMGYHGTRTVAAEAIARSGLLNMVNEEGRSGVSAWDSIVAYEASRFAIRRAREAGDYDMGRVVELRMIDPHEDSWHGRLEWLARAEATEVLGVYDLASFHRYIGEKALAEPDMYDNRF